MTSTLENGKYAEIDESAFETLRGVTKARDTETGVDVMIKGLHVISKPQYEGIKEEAEKLQSLDHPNIVKFIEFIDRCTPEWSFGPMCFIIMEFCSNGSLVDLIERRKLANELISLEEATLMGAQLIKALSFCHEKMIVHQDLKPSNIFIDADGKTLKIGDFGSASTVQSVVLTARTESSGVKNTPLYAPPETFEGEGVTKSARLDVWGIGIVLQELITFEHPFGRINGKTPTKNQEDIIANIRSGSRTLISEVRGEENEFQQFELFVSSCLNTDKLDRPKNAIALKDHEVFSRHFQEIIEDKETKDGLSASDSAIERVLAVNRGLIERIKQLESENKKICDEQKRQADEITMLREDRDSLVASQRRLRNHFFLKQADLEDEIGPLNGAGLYYGLEDHEARKGMSDDMLEEILRMMSIGCCVNIKEKP